MNKKQISINMLSGIISSALTLLISFLLTPYLVQHLGDEAYGYIGLSGTFITIASVFTVALNSMANRFIMIAYEKKDYKKVNEYFSSLFVAGVVLSVIFLLAGLLISFNIEKIFNITPALLSAVKTTFVLSVANFAVITLFTVFSTAVYVKNRLELTAKVDIVANVFKVLFLIAIFTLFTPKLFYVTIGGLIYTIVLYIGHVKNTKKLLPEVQIKAALAKWATIKELTFSGTWNSFNTIIQFLMVGLDLALANWLLDGRAMGLMSISGTINIALNSVLVVVIGSFKPTLAKTYAGGDLNKLHQQIKTSERLQCAIMFVPIAGLCIFAPKFYSLWLPYKNTQDIMMISAITFVKVFDQFAGLTNVNIGSNFYLFNKQKGSAIAKLGLSAINIPLVVILVKLVNNYNLSIIIIAGLSSFLYLIYYWIVVPILASKITGQKLSDYYKIILQTIFMFITLIVPFYFINKITVCSSWFSFIILIVITGALGYILMFFIGVNKQERKAVYNKIEAITRRKNNG